VFSIKRFLEIINIPKHIKRYVIIKRIERYCKPRNHRFLVWVVNVFIFVVLLGALSYIYFINTNQWLKYIATLTVIILILLYMVYLTVYVLLYEKRKSGISQIILKGEDGRNIQVWDLQNQSALLIGKKTRENDVDIDLSVADYASLISKEHAVLNYAGDHWFIEDIGSTNGSGIKRRDENSKEKIQVGKPYQLNTGDIVYIANTQLLTK
jgi:hypothetical protein